MPRCAFLTLENMDGWFVDDELVHEPLQNLGWAVDDVPWKKPVDWNDYDLVVIRSTWDYQESPEFFFSVLESIEASSAQLQNPLRLVRWNLDKRYLLELEKRGVAIVPTHYVESLTPDAIRAGFSRFGDIELMVKPSISANADGTWRLKVDASSAELQEVCDAYRGKRALVQPFLGSILAEGEYSLVYFNGELHHGVVKTVKPGDFRVQEEHGGKVQALPDLRPETIEVANRAIQNLEITPLYARVDLIADLTGQFVVMEVELVEPSLYFKYHDEAATRFAELIDRQFQLS